MLISEAINPDGSVNSKHPWISGLKIISIKDLHGGYYLTLVNGQKIFSPVDADLETLKVNLHHKYKLHGSNYESVEDRRGRLVESAEDRKTRQGYGKIDIQAWRQIQYRRRRSG